MHMWRTCHIEWFWTLLFNQVLPSYKLLFNSFLYFKLVVTKYTYFVCYIFDIFAGQTHYLSCGTSMNPNYQRFTTRESYWRRETFWSQLRYANLKNIHLSTCTMHSCNENRDTCNHQISLILNDFHHISPKCWMGRKCPQPSITCSPFCVDNEIWLSFCNQNLHLF